MTVREFINRLNEDPITRYDNEIFVSLNVEVSDRSIVSADLKLKDIDFEDFDWADANEIASRVILKF